MQMIERNEAILNAVRHYLKSIPIKDLDTLDKEFLEMMIRQYPKAYACCKKIRDYIKQKLNYEFQDEEMVYLIVHMKRITRGLEE